MSDFLSLNSDGDKEILVDIFTRIQCYRGLTLHSDDGRENPVDIFARFQYQQSSYHDYHW